MSMTAVETAVDSEVYDVAVHTGFVLGQVTQSAAGYSGVWSGWVEGAHATVAEACVELAFVRDHESSGPVVVTNQTI